jgi:hypothetical protein
MSEKHRNFSPEEKVGILKKHLLEKIPHWSVMWIVDQCPGTLSTPIELVWSLKSSPT